MMRLLWLILLLPGMLAAQPGALIRGRVSDAQTGEPLPEANILYARDRGVATDMNGQYFLPLSPGQVNLTFQYLGYKTEHRSIGLRPGDTLHLDIRLEPEITQMEQVVISGIKREQRIAETTVSMSIIRPGALSASHINDPKELMNRTPGIEVLDGQASIRGGSGFSYGAGSRVLALIDGLPALAADAGSIRWGFLPLENISQVEVIKGASSVLYGSSALNGIINFRSATPTTQGRTSFFAETGLYDRPSRKAWKWWDSPRVFSSASVSHMKRYGNTGVSAGGFATSTNGYRRLNDEHLGRLSLRLNHEHAGLPGLQYGLNILAGYNQKRDFVLWEDAWQGALKQSPATASLLHGSFLAVDPAISYTSGEHWRHDLRMRLQRTNNRFPQQGHNDSEARSLYAEYQAWHRISQVVSINAGLVQYLGQVRSSFYGDHNMYNAAVYTQADISPSERLTLVGGLRLEHNSLDGTPGDAVPLLRSGINYRVAPITFLRASIGQGYRYPSIAEKYAATTLGAVRIFPNPDILPESGWSLETGIKQGILTGYLDGMLDLALFYSQNKDMIEYVVGIYSIPGSDDFDFGFRATNIEHSRVYGLELEYVFNNRIGRLQNTLRGGYVYMYPVEFDPRTNRNTGEFLKFRRKHAFTMHITSAWRRLEAGLGVRIRSRILDIDDVFLNEMTREMILPGFYDYWQQHNEGHWVADLNLGYQLSPSYRISFLVKNLFNAEYMGRPGDIQPHRHFSLRFSGSW